MAMQHHAVTGCTQGVSEEVREGGSEVGYRDVTVSKKAQ